MPPAGALPLRVMTPLGEMPPTTGDGLIVNVLTDGAFTVMDALPTIPPAVAVKVMLVDRLTGNVVTGKVVDVCPTGTTMVTAHCAI